LEPDPGHAGAGKRYFRFAVSALKFLTPFFSQPNEDIVIV